jgi:O-antigen ligase/Flp pilus assembly protein TadD
MAAALAIAPLAFVNGAHDPANLPQSAWAQVAGFLLAAAVMAGRPDPGRSVLDLPVLALAAWGAASVAWAHARGEAVPVALHWLAGAAWFAAASRAVASAADARALALAVFASGAAVAAIGLAQHAAGLDFFYQAVPPAATFVHKNIASQYVVAALPLGLAAWRPERPRLTVASGAVLLGAGLMALFLVVARTRSAWVAAVAEAGVIAWLALRATRPRAIRFAALAFLALALAAGIAASASPSLRARVLALAIPPAPRGGEAAPAFTSVHHRQAIWLNTAAMVADHPLAGVGLGNHDVHYPAYARRVAVDPIMGAEAQLDYAHNDYLQLAAETGLVGLALLAWLLWRAVAAWRAAAAGALPLPVAIAWAGAGAGIATDALFSFPMQRALPPVLAAAGLGGVAALAGRAPGRGGPRAARAAATLALAGAVVAGAFQARALRADRAVLRMLSAESRRDWASAAREAEAVLAINPRDRRALFTLGTAALARGRLPEARAALARVLEERPHDLVALGNLALARAAGGDDAGALALFDRMLALDPDDHRAHYGRAEILAGRGAVWPALHELRLAVALDRANAFYQYRRGVLAAKVGSYPEAATAFRAAIGLQPRYAAAHQALGRVLIDHLGQAEEGQAHLRRAEELTGR